MKITGYKSLDIVNIFKYYNFNLIESGDRFICFCPFHDDKNTPNLTIYPKTNTFHCFTCKKTGDALTLIAYMEKITIQEVKQKLGTDFLRAVCTTKRTTTLDFYKKLLIDTAQIFYEELHTTALTPQIIAIMQETDKVLADIYINKINVDFILYTKILEELKNKLVQETVCQK